MAAKKIKLAPLHPGEILREDFMDPMGLSINALARALRQGGLESIDFRTSEAAELGRQCVA